MNTTLTEERWAPVNGWPYYDISDHGRMRSWHRTGRRRTEQKRAESPRPMKIGLNKRTNCQVVTLADNGRYLDKHVHRIVAEAFLPPQPSPLHQINHIDGNRQHNHATNLEWMTARENIHHAWRTGLMSKQPQKLTWEQVCEIRRIHAEHGTRRVDLAKQFKVTPTCVSLILSGKSRVHDWAAESANHATR